MTDPATELNELHILSDGGKAGWWHELVHLTHRGCEYGLTPDRDNPKILPSDALDLVRAEAERWLVEKGWVFERQQERTCYTPCDYSIRFHTLAEALKHAVTNPPTSQTSAEEQ